MNKKHIRTLLFTLVFAALLGCSAFACGAGTPVPENRDIKGVVHALSLVNPNDIETFTVLKDEFMAEVSRSITDVTRLSPYGGNGMSFAGADGRIADFAVDGENGVILVGDTPLIRFRAVPCWARCRLPSDGFEGKQVIISGSGNVAVYSDRAVRRDIEIVRGVRDAVRIERIRASRLASPDTVLPCPTQDGFEAVQERIAKGISDTAEYLKTTALFAPGKAAIAGGVAVSASEMIQQNCERLIRANEDAAALRESVQTDAADIAGLAIGVTISVVRALF